MVLMQTYCYNFQFTRNTNNGETSLKKYDQKKKKNTTEWKKKKKNSNKK